MTVQSTGNRDSFTEINITPLTDIFLVLLIIMMVIAPMFQQPDNDIILPSINSGLSVDEKLVTVFVTKNAKFFIGSDVVEENKLSEKLAELLPKEEGEEKKLVVKADSQTKTKYIMTVMKAAQEAGYEKLTVAGEPLSTSQQTDLERGGLDEKTKTLSQSRETVSEFPSKNAGRQRINLPQ